MPEIKCQDPQHPTRAGEPDFDDGILVIASKAIPDVYCSACVRVDQAARAQARELELAQIATTLGLTRAELAELPMSPAALRALGKIAGKTGVR